MDELIQAMSIDELVRFKEQYAANESVTKIVDGYIETKTRQEAQVKAREDFVKVIDKMVNKLPHPDDVHNVYFAWREVEEEDKTQEAEEVEIVYTDGEKGTEVRYPKVKVDKWVVELNKGFQIAKGTSTASSATSKRAITVHKRNGTSLEFVGNFTNATKACEHLELIVGGDSAMRVLTVRNPYLVDPYTGTDFTS